MIRKGALLTVPVLATFVAFDVLVESRSRAARSWMCDWHGRQGTAMVRKGRTR